MKRNSPYLVKRGAYGMRDEREMPDRRDSGPMKILARPAFLRVSHEEQNTLPPSLPIPTGKQV